LILYERHKWIQKLPQSVFLLTHDNKKNSVILNFLFKKKIMINLKRAQRAFSLYQASSLNGSRVLIYTGNCSATNYASNQRTPAFTQWISGNAVFESDMLVIIHSNGIDYIQKHIKDSKTEKLNEQGAEARRFSDISECFSKSAGQLVQIPRESALQQSDFASKVAAVATGAGSAKDEVAVSVFVSDCIAVKDDSSIDSSKKAGALCTALVKRYVSEELAKIAAKPAERKLHEFVETLKTKIAKPNTIPGLENMKNEGYNIGYIDAPRVFAGDSARKSKDMVLRKGGPLAHLKLPAGDDCTFENAPSVAMLFGAKHNNYVVAFGRTFFMGSEPSAETKKAYKFLMVLESCIAKRLSVPNTTFGQVYNGAIEDAKKAVPDSQGLINSLPVDFGGIVGLHNHDPRLAINNEKGANTPVLPGMSILVRLILLPQDVAEANGGSAQLIGDTPLVLANTYQIPVAGGGAAVSLTKASPPVDECVIKAAAEDGEESESEVNEDSAPVQRIQIVTRAQKGLLPDQSAEQTRITTLKNLLKSKHEDWIARGRPRGGTDVSNSEEFRIFELGRLGRGDTVAYPALEQAPAQYTNLRNDIVLDRLPLHGPSGPLVPIHVSAIQKIDLRSVGQQEHYFTVTFHSTQEGNLAFRSNRTKVFVRETTFSGPDSGKFYQIQNQVKELQQVIKTKDNDRKSKIGVVDQKGLKLSSAPDKLPQVKCRPPPAANTTGRARGAGSSGTEGNLEAHDNGFRFTYPGGNIDILYDNVKFMIVQPSKNDILVIFHLALRSPISLGGNKKTDHIQFVAEVMEGTVGTVGGRMTADEEDAREAKDEERIKKTNIQFVQFGKKVNQRSGLRLEQPFSNVNFEGSASRGTVNFRGNENCLWSIIEFPCFVLSMENMEVVALERVITGNINFDIAFVHNDYRTVTNVTTVPMTDLEKVKDWLLRTKNIFFEATINLSWNTVLKQIRDDPDWIPYSEKGGWATMMDDYFGDEAGDDEDEGEGDGDADGDDDDDDEDSDDTYEESEEDSDEDFDSSDDDDDDSDDEDASDEDDESDEDSDDSDDRRRSKKHKAEKTRRR
jgi:nucleosome binding factor SPN SPT16 subunit